MHFLASGNHANDSKVSKGTNPPMLTGVCWGGGGGVSALLFVRTVPPAFGGLRGGLSPGTPLRVGFPFLPVDVHPPGVDVHFPGVDFHFPGVDFNFIQVDAHARCV
jgi:hypothetical protein